MKTAVAALLCVFVWPHLFSLRYPPERDDRRRSVRALCCGSGRKSLFVSAPSSTTERKSLRVGQRFEVETFEPVLMSGHVVIPSGTPGVGEVTSVTNKGMWGKSGHFDLRLLYLRVGDRQIRLSGTRDDKGKAGGVGAVAVSAIVFLPAGFFMTGTSARLPAGTVIKGFVDEDVPAAFAGTDAPVSVVASAVGRHPGSCCCQHCGSCA